MVVMYLLHHKGYCLLSNHWLTVEDKKFSSGKMLQGEVSVGVAGSGMETSQRSIALLRGDNTLQP